MTTKHIKTDFSLIAIDDTRYWVDSVQKAAGKIHTVYLYDKNRQVNLAEIRPSVALIPVFCITQNEVDDDTENDLHHFQNEIYLHTSYVLEHEKLHAHLHVHYGEESHEVEEGYDSEESYMMIEEKMIERVKADQPYICTEEPQKGLAP